MTGTATRPPSRRVRRLGTAAGWVAAVACLPYLILKLLWTLDIAVGITDRSVLDSSGWMAGNAMMAVVQLAGLVLVLTLIQPWSRRVPAWLVLFPAWLGTGLLFQVVVGVVFLAGSAVSSDANLSTGSFQPWVFLVVYASFAAEGIALSIAFACHVQSRWGRTLALRTAAAVSMREASRGTEAAPWPVAHVTAMAQALAVMCVAVAVGFGYWALGGSLGLPSIPSPAPLALQASRAAGAGIAAVGLLGLAGRVLQRTHLWVPAGLTWLGSGAMTAFDGLVLTFSAVLPQLGVAAAGAGWGLTDTVHLVKVLIGVLTAAVGVIAFTAANRAVREADAG
jgi:hypothetical protein